MYIILPAELSTFTVDFATFLDFQHIFEGIYLLYGARLTVDL